MVTRGAWADTVDTQQAEKAASAGADRERSEATTSDPGLAARYVPETTAPAASAGGLNFAGYEQGAEGSRGGSNLVESLSGEYEGEARTIVYHVSATTMEVVDSREYDTEAGVSIGAPISVSGHAEDNPIHLFIWTGDQFQEGSMLVSSATSWVDPLDGVEVLFQHWNLDADEGSIDGTLTNTYYDAGVSIGNSIVVSMAPSGEAGESVGLEPMPTTVPMNAGTTLSGKVDGDRLTLRLKSSTGDTVRPFVSEMVLERKE